MLSELLAEAKRISELGCSDGNCKFRGPSNGMHTNGGCHCQADPNWNGRGSTYRDTMYMAQLLGLIVLELKDKVIE